MVRLRVITDDGRSAAQRAQALHQARDRPEARELLAAVLAPLREAQRLAQVAAEAKPGPVTQLPARFWALLDQAYLALDRYLADLLHAAAIDPACGPRCSACCTDLPPILPVEGLRMARTLRARADGRVRLQRAVDQTRAFQQVLMAHTGGARTKLDGTETVYREAQLDWRRRGYPCPVLGDDGSCSAYASRPLSCRVHVHVEDPAHCEPSSPRFLHAERPPLWGHPRECEVELALATIGKLLGLQGAPNLPWGLAVSHDHPLARPEADPR